MNRIGVISKVKTIFHVDMDAFFVSVETLLNPALQGKPVIVGGLQGRGVVAAASYEARKFGIHSALPMAQARRLCPHAIFLSGRQTQYHKYSERVFAILREYTPLVEVISIDEAYLDMTGTEMLWGDPLRAGTSILVRIQREIGLPASLGIANNKLIAKIASELAKPKGLLWIPSGHEAKFIGCLPVKTIPGLGEKAAAKLTFIGIRTVRDLAAQDPQYIRRVLGDWAMHLVKKAKGFGSNNVHSEGHAAQSISHEVTFHEDLLDPERMKAALLRLAEKAGNRLRQAGLMSWTICLKLRYDNFATLTRHVSLNQPTDIDQAIFSAAWSLFQRCYQSGRKVRLLGICAQHLTAASFQQHLFDEDRWGKLRRMNTGVDQIRNKFGKTGIITATQLWVAAPQPDQKKHSPGSAAPLQ